MMILLKDIFLVQNHMMVLILVIIYRIWIVKH